MSENILSSLRRKLRVDPVAALTSLKAPQVRSVLLAVMAERARRVSQAHPAVAFGYDLSRTRQATYYRVASFHVLVDGFPRGATPIVDGGLVPWTGVLLSNRKHQAMTSGLGLSTARSPWHARNR